MERKEIMFENEDLYILQDLANAYIVGKGVLDEHIICLSDRDLENRIVDIIKCSKKPIFYDDEWKKHFEELCISELILDSENLINLVHRTLELETKLSVSELNTLARNVIEHIENESEYLINERENN